MQRKERQLVVDCPPPVTLSRFQLGSWSEQDRKRCKHDHKGHRRFQEERGNERRRDRNHKGVNYVALKRAAPRFIDQTCLHKWNALEVLHHGCHPRALRVQANPGTCGRIPLPHCRVQIPVHNVTTVGANVNALAQRHLCSLVAL